MPLGTILLDIKWVALIMIWMRIKKTVLCFSQSHRETSLLNFDNRFPNLILGKISIRKCTRKIISKNRIWWDHEIRENTSRKITTEWIFRKDINIQKLTFKTKSNLWEKSLDKKIEKSNAIKFRTVAKVMI